MYELIPVSRHDWYIDCPAKIGLVQTGDKEVILIDSGSDKDAAKKVLRHIDANGWKLTAIFATHSHADHIGGCKLLQDRTGCTVYAPGLDAVYTNHPELEAMTLWGGKPFKDLANKFLMAQPCRAETLTREVLPEGMEMIPLPGHCFDMVGYRTKDGNVFLGDCVSSEETLRKYGIGYLWDPGAGLAALEQVKTLRAERFIPAHAPVTEDIIPLAERNIAAIEDTAQKLLEILSTPVTFEDALAQIFAAYGLTMNAQQYVLIGSTLRSYLSWLHSQGKAAFRFENNRMLWQQVMHEQL